jgi:hypothetical protein
MNKRCAFLIHLILLLIIIGIPTGRLMREYRRDESNKVNNVF